mmetsp:Transcript_2583/g.3428  ORF Transcript_2583/g.3428 Transcript_2583/m.3428 type:complete len:150 (-) Transcript_2583:81-530(-)|eukprot:CAMPEP_0168558686 /NCGR_PEP_ID=MMETSP0413-20121227/10108_1 /TAXON_ID=136452 /ORGANISM="Filamoeba nolandi, Strain NC-AS-23-1" /LENGTH=149 /DNA_ID=CAMNT_0008589835 /DNA_START=42 /DNA_END=491 /DNA_ORIENTATION=-
MSRTKAELSPEQIEEFKLAFEMFDENGQGYLTKADLKGVLEKYGLNAKLVDEMFKEADVTGSGKIGFPEFMSLMARGLKQADTQDELLEAFKVFDPYNEGFISEKDLAEALLTTGDKLTKEELNEMLSVCCVDKQVNYTAFVNQMYANK